jgi:hypothetical protein
LRQPSLQDQLDAPLVEAAFQADRIDMWVEQAANCRMHGRDLALGSIADLVESGTGADSPSGAEGGDDKLMGRPDRIDRPDM